MLLVKRSMDYLLSLEYDNEFMVTDDVDRNINLEGYCFFKKILPGFETVMLEPLFLWLMLPQDGQSIQKHGFPSLLTFYFAKLKIEILGCTF